MLIRLCFASSFNYRWWNTNCSSTSALMLTATGEVNYVARFIGFYYRKNLFHKGWFNVPPKIIECCLLKTLARSFCLASPGEINRQQVVTGCRNNVRKLLKPIGGNVWSYYNRLKYLPRRSGVLNCCSNIFIFFNLLRGSKLQWKKIFVNLLKGSKLQLKYFSIYLRVENCN